MEYTFKIKRKNATTKETAFIKMQAPIQLGDAVREHILKEFEMC